jgi:Zn finger protein HypA/HybF involved in hydrogenase expression
MTAMRTLREHNIKMLCLECRTPINKKKFKFGLCKKCSEGWVKNHADA